MLKSKKVGLMLQILMLLLSMLLSTGCCLMGVCLQKEQQTQVVLGDNTVTLIQPNTSTTFLTPKWCFGNEAVIRMREKLEACSIK